MLQSSDLSGKCREVLHNFKLNTMKHLGKSLNILFYVIIYVHDRKYAGIDNS